MTWLESLDGWDGLDGLGECHSKKTYIYRAYVYWALYVGFFAVLLDQPTTNPTNYLRFFKSASKLFNFNAC